MKILAVDTTAVAASCAVVEDSKLICESFVNVKLKHSQTLIAYGKGYAEVLGS